MKMMIPVILVIVLAGCLPMSDDTARRAVEGVGVTNVQITGMAFLGCDEKDTFRSSFTGKNSKGQQVSGSVCGGFFKGATVRFD